MEKRLKKLKGNMENTTFQTLSFSEQQRKQIFEKINQQQEKEEDILVAILQLLNKRRTGYELTELLRMRGLKRFDKREGFIYALLHRLEQKLYILSEWEDGDVKYYVLQKKGKRLLRKMERNTEKKGELVRELIEGMSLN